ncbi:hypothetical protein LJK88_23090 [Paenibacillus sp. P26]|nr:hypothetical protein LJK88_23090 [Paenibacillus sp. P26]
MPLGFLFGGLFFASLAIAALTSAISILEVPVAFAMHKWNWSRVKASVILSSVCFIVGIPAALSIGGPLGGFTPGGKSIFDWFDYTTAYILMPLGGLIVTIFTGYAWKLAGEEAALTSFWYKAWMFLLRIIVPILIVLIFLYSVGIIKF